MSPTGNFTLVAGSGITRESEDNGGDGGQAILARFSFQTNLLVDQQGTIYVLDRNNLRKISPFILPSLSLLPNCNCNNCRYYL